jgi:maltose alpha-D-glucosyltransferase/alpha-amylase
VAYEAENRPTWLPVPLHGLYGLLSGLKPFSDLGGE